MLEKIKTFPTFLHKLFPRNLSLYAKIVGTFFISYIISTSLSTSLFLNNTPRVNPGFITSVGQNIQSAITEMLTGEAFINSSTTKTGAIILPWYYCPPDGRTCIPDRWKYKPPGSDTPYPNGQYYRPGDESYWKIQASDMTCSGLDIAFIYTWESQIQYFNHFKRFADVIQASNSPIKIAEYWDASFASNDGGPTDLADPATAQYRYEKFIRPFYQTIPQDLWATENGRPMLTVYRYGEDAYINTQSANVFFQNIKNLFIQDFGVEPFLNLGSQWFITSTGGEIADGKHEVFNASVACDGNARTHTINGYTTSSVSPGGWDYRDFGCHLPRNDDTEFRKGLGQVPSNANLVIIESWNELGEGSGMERAVNYPANAGGFLPETFYLDSLRNYLGKTDRGSCKSIPEILNTSQPTIPPGQPTLTPFPTQPPQPTAPPGQPTYTPYPTQPPQQPTSPPSQTPGSVKIVVHLDSINGPLWNGQTDIEVYIEGPSNGNHRFGELLYVKGRSSGNCKSRGNFPYDCSVAGTATWKGADGKSGTAPGSYTATIFKAQAGWNVILKQASGNLSPSGTLTLDLVVSSRNMPTLPSQPTPTIGGGGGNLACPTTSTQSYTSKSVGRYNHNKLKPPLEEHPEVNLRLRGWGETNESTSLQSRNGNWNGLDDKKPPQYSTLFNGPIPNIAKTYVTYAWDFENKKSLAPEVSTPNFKVHMIGFEANQGQPLYGLDAGRTIDGTNVFLVLHATKNDILFTHSDEDNIDDGYLFYFVDICVDPNLLARYNNDANGGRSQLPVIAPGQIFGYAADTDPKSSVRDTMSFVDPRSKEDWWFYPR